MAKRGVGDPRYLQIATHLRDEIARGEYGEGSQLPTEAELCARFGVSRFTVREALRQLQTEGMISRRRGSGTTVAPPNPNRLTRHSLSNVEEILQYAANSEFSFDYLGLISLTAKQARDVGAKASDRWCGFTGLRTVGGSGRPIAFTEVFVHPDLAGAAAGIRENGQPIFRQLERLGGVRLARIDQDIQAVAANRLQAEALQIQRRAPCLRIVRIYYDASGRLFELSSSIQPGDRFTYSMHIDSPG